MNLKSIFCVVFLVFGIVVNAQNYVIYDVKPNDTPQSIAQANAISLDLLYKYNPDLKQTKSIGAQKIVIPKGNNKNFGFLRYRVKTQQTLYSLSRYFNLSIADIKAFNPKLYERELKAGEVLQLPAYKLPEAYQNLDFNQSIKNSNFKAFKHIVLPDERKSDIIEKYGMSVQAFDSINQGLLEVQSGQMVKVVPFKAETDQYDYVDLDMELQYYKVPARQTLYSLSKEFKVSEEIIFKLNPIVRREGLKADMIIKLPKQIDALSGSKIVNLENYIQNFNEKKLALLLPFSLNQFEKDSVDIKSILLRDNLLNISIDIYEGVEWAVEHAKSKGIYTDLKVYDTKRNPNVVNSIVSENDLSDRDAIIGPILDKNITKLSEKLDTYQTPIFLPISSIENSSSYIFNTLPQQNIKTETLITYIDSIHTPKQNLIFITDSTSSGAYEKYKYTFPKATFLQLKKTYIETDEVKKLLKKDKENWVILETNQMGISESVVNNLYKFQKGFSKEDSDKNIQFDIKLFTSDLNQAYGEVIDNIALTELGFTYISASKYNILETNDLIKEYTEKNGIVPSRYVLRAFDLTYDILLRLAYNGDLKDKQSLKPLTEYVENRFGYEQSFMSDVYHNKGIYIISYKPDFEVEIINTDKSEN